MAAGGDSPRGGGGYGTPPPSGGGFGPPPHEFGAPPPGGGFGAPPGPHGFGPPPGASNGSAGTLAIVSLVLSIVSWFFCPIFFSVPAMVLAKMEMGKIDRGESPPAGRGLAQAAFWVSVANVVAYGAFMCLYFVFVVGIFGLAAAGQAG